jgi:hypothetical protein
MGDEWMTKKKESKKPIWEQCPSFTILGGPHLLCNATFLPLGPNVTPSSSATKSTPACSTIKKFTHSIISCENK